MKVIRNPHNGHRIAQSDSIAGSLSGNATGSDAILIADRPSFADNAARPFASTVAFTQNVAQAMAASYVTLQRDIAANASQAQIQDDIRSYYLVQNSQRGYASLAAEVAGNIGLNGTEPNAEVETFYHDSGFGANELKLSEALATQDYKNITDDLTINPNQGGLLYVPTIADDVKLHTVVFQDLGIPIQFWGGTPCASANVNWMPGYANSAELQNAGGQKAALGPLSDYQIGYSAGLLLGTGLQTDPLTIADNLGEFFNDVVTLKACFSSLSLSTLATYGMNVQGGNGLPVQVTLNTAKLAQTTGLDFSDGRYASIVETLANTYTTWTYNNAAGGGLIEGFSPGQVFSTAAGYAFDLFGNNDVVTSVNSVVSLFGSTVTTLNVSGSNLTIDGSLNDLYWVGANTSAAISSGGTIGVSNGDVLAASASTLVVQSGVSASIVGVNDAAGIWGSNDSLTGTLLTVYLAPTLTGETVAGSQNAILAEGQNGLTVKGSGNTIYGTATVNIGGQIGTFDTITDLGGGNHFMLGAGSTLTINGSGDVATLGSASSLTVNGTSNSLVAGASSSIVINGSSNALTASGASIAVATGVQLTVTGSSDTVRLASGTGTNTNVLINDPTRGTSAYYQFNPGNGLAETVTTYTGQDKGGVVSNITNFSAGGDTQSIALNTVATQQIAVGKPLSVTTRFADGTTSVLTYNYGTIQSDRVGTTLDNYNVSGQRVEETRASEGSTFNQILAGYVHSVTYYDNDPTQAWSTITDNFLGANGDGTNAPNALSSVVIQNRDGSSLSAQAIAGQPWITMQFAIPGHGQVGGVWHTVIGGGAAQLYGQNIAAFAPAADLTADAPHMAFLYPTSTAIAFSNHALATPSSDVANFYAGAFEGSTLAALLQNEGAAGIAAGFLSQHLASELEVVVSSGVQLGLGFSVTDCFGHSLGTSVEPLPSEGLQWISIGSDIPTY